MWPKDGLQFTTSTSISFGPARPANNQVPAAYPANNQVPAAYPTTTQAQAPRPAANTPAQVARPWTTQWDADSQAWYYWNEETGESSWTVPKNAYTNGAQARPYNQAPAGQAQYAQQKPRNNLGKKLAAGAAGLLGGAFAKREGHDVKQQWRNDEYRIDSRVDDAAHWAGETVQNADEDLDNLQNHLEGRWDDVVSRVDGLPENVDEDIDNLQNHLEGRWDDVVSRVDDLPEEAEQQYDEVVDNVEDVSDRVEQEWDETVDRVEDIPERVEQEWDEAVDQVEDIPDHVAYEAGEAVGEVEEYADGIAESYDEGREDARDDDNE